MVYHGVNKNATMFTTFPTIFSSPLKTVPSFKSHCHIVIWQIPLTVIHKSLVECTKLVSVLSNVMVKQILPVYSLHMSILR